MSLHQIPYIHKLLYLRTGHFQTNSFQKTRHDTPWSFKLNSCEFSQLSGNFESQFPMHHIYGALSISSTNFPWGHKPEENLIPKVLGMFIVPNKIWIWRLDGQQEPDTIPSCLHIFHAIFFKVKTSRATKRDVEVLHLQSQRLSVQEHGTPTSRIIPLLNDTWEWLIKFGKYSIYVSATPGAGELLGLCVAEVFFHNKLI